MTNILDILVSEQLHNLPPRSRLCFKDMMRISKKIDDDIVHNDKCVIWKGYICHNRNEFIGIHFRGKKVTLNRLLYINYVGPLSDHEYLRTTCKTVGCCTISHMQKCKYDVKKPVDKKKKKISSVFNSTGFTLKFFN